MLPWLKGLGSFFDDIYYFCYSHCRVWDFVVYLLRISSGSFEWKFYIDFKMKLVLFVKKKKHICWVIKKRLKCERQINVNYVMQVASCMDEIHADMGVVLVLLHTNGVRLLPGIAWHWEPLCARHCRPVIFPCWHCFAFLCGLQR